MKWLTDLVADARAILLAPITSVLCLSGAVLVLASFVDYSRTQGLALHSSCHWQMLACGVVFLAAAITIFLHTRSDLPRGTRLDYDKGVEIKRQALTIVVKAGEIQRLTALTANSAVVLPANTTFIDGNSSAVCNGWGG